MVKKKPTELELAILKVLWERGPSTVREVMEVLAEERSLGYTTVLKMLQVMTKKGLVAHSGPRPYRYRTRSRRAATLKSLAGDLLDRAFDGSASQLLLHALEHKQACPDEIEEIRRLLDRLENEQS